MQFQKIISSSLSPNTEADDVREAIRVLLSPADWLDGSAIGEVEQWFQEYLGVPSAVSFDSGRSALYAILQAFGIGIRDEVMVQAFTCVAVPNSVRWTGARPVYVDIDGSYNIDPHDVMRKLTSRTKAIVVQHTFGIPANMDAIMRIAKVRNILIIEDCAHSLGATYKNKKVGTLGDAAFFSFGRDKVLSSVWGGVAALNVKYQMSNVKENLKKSQENLLFPSRIWVVQQLFHPIAFGVILPLYHLMIGKILLECFKRLRFLSKPVDDGELKGEKPSCMPRRYPNALARLLVRQLTKLGRVNDVRRRSALYYQKALRTRSDITILKEIPGSVSLRFPILVRDQLGVMRRAKKKGILLGNWYQHVIDPKSVDLGVIGYVGGSCPKAEQYAQHIVNLPTLVTRQDARRVIDAI